MFPEFQITTPEFQITVFEFQIAVLEYQISSVDTGSVLSDRDDVLVSK